MYWAGPILGGVVAGLIYEHLLAVNASVAKVKGFLLTSDYDDDRYKAAISRVSYMPIMLSILYAVLPCQISKHVCNTFFLTNKIMCHT